MLLKSFRQCSLYYLLTYLRQRSHINVYGQLSSLSIRDLALYTPTRPGVRRPRPSASHGSELAPDDVGIHLAHIAALEVLAHLPLAGGILHGEQPRRLDVRVDAVLGEVRVGRAWLG